MNLRFADAAVVQVMDSIGRNRGGLTRAVFERFRLLAEDRRSILVTVAYQPDVREVFDELKRDGMLPQHTELLSFYEDQRQTPRKAMPQVTMPHEKWEVEDKYQAATEATAHGSQIRFFNEGSFVGLIYRDHLGVLRHVDRHDVNRPWLREYRDTCWSDGIVARREYFDEQNKARFRVYLDATSRAFLSAWVSPEGYEYRTIEHLATGSVQHGDTRAANAAWLERKLTDIGPSIIYTDEPRATFALAVTSPDIFHVTSIHTTHYKNNKNNEDGIKHWATHYVTHKDNIGRLVFFTESQRSDFIVDTDFPSSKAIVVAHAAPLSAAGSLGHIQRNEMKFVTVSRLADDKRIADAIHAFAKVCEKYPTASYDIWGSGPAAGSLKNLVSDLGLTGNVTLGGHTAEPLSKFASSAASVLTSRYEGFGLVLTESFSCGTPVIAYDVIYGPRDVISPSNGFLIEDGNVEALADAMISIISNAAQLEKLREGAMDTASRYTKERWVRGWRSTSEVTERDAPR